MFQSCLCRWNPFPLSPLPHTRTLISICGAGFGGKSGREEQKHGQVRTQGCMNLQL